MSRAQFQVRVGKKKSELPEPAATQEWIRETTKGNRRWIWEDPRGREDAIADLARVAGKEARKFRRENPGADINDYERWQKSH